MSLLNDKYQDAERALHSLEAILEEKPSEIIRDAAIQRFEFTVEAVWKYAKTYLHEQEGIECYSPKSCLREIHAIGKIEEDETVKLLAMIDDRNQTVHTYHEEVAKEIFRKIPECSQLLRTIMTRLQPKIGKNQEPRTKSQN